MLTKLNLGCGEFKKAGYINVDLPSNSMLDVAHDLNQFPYPFEDNQFERIELDHLLEHLNRPFQVMRDIHRIGRNGCSVNIKVPHFSRGFTHAQHKRGFDVTFPLYFNPSFRGGYQGVAYDLKRIRLRWFAQPYLKKTVLSTPAYQLTFALGTIFDFLANLSPVICSRIWCYWVGGFEELEMELIVIK